MDISDANAQAQADQGNVTMNGILSWDNAKGASGGPAPNTLAGQMAAGFTLQFAQGQRGTANGQPAGQNFVVSNPLLNRPLEPSDPDFSGRFSSPLFRAGFVAPPDDGFFDQAARFIGGIGDENWTEEWTSFLQDSDIAP